MREGQGRPDTKGWRIMACMKGGSSRRSDGCRAEKIKTCAVVVALQPVSLQISRSIRQKSQIAVKWGTGIS